MINRVYNNVINFFLRIEYRIQENEKKSFGYILYNDIDIFKIDNDINELYVNINFHKFINRFIPRSMYYNINLKLIELILFKLKINKNLTIVDIHPDGYDYVIKYAN